MIYNLFTYKIIKLCNYHTIVWFNKMFKWKKKEKIKKKEIMIINIWLLLCNIYSNLLHFNTGVGGGGGGAQGGHGPRCWSES